MVLDRYQVCVSHWSIVPLRILVKFCQLIQLIYLIFYFPGNQYGLNLYQLEEIINLASIMPQKKTQRTFRNFIFTKKITWKDMWWGQVYRWKRKCMTQFSHSFKTQSLFMKVITDNLQLKIRLLHGLDTGSKCLNNTHISQEIETSSWESFRTPPPLCLGGLICSIPIWSWVALWWVFARLFVFSVENTVKSQLPGIWKCTLSFPILQMKKT